MWRVDHSDPFYFERMEGESTAFSQACIPLWKEVRERVLARIGDGINAALIQSDIPMIRLATDPFLECSGAMDGNVTFCLVDHSQPQFELLDEDVQPGLAQLTEVQRLHIYLKLIAKRAGELCKMAKDEEDAESRSALIDRLRTMQRMTAVHAEYLANVGTFG